MGDRRDEGVEEWNTKNKTKQNKEIIKRWWNEGTDTGLRFTPYETGPYLIAPAIHTPPWFGWEGKPRGDGAAGKNGPYLPKFLGRVQDWSPCQGLSTQRCGIASVARNFYGDYFKKPPDKGTPDADSGTSGVG
jgi:hypothetical protein